MSSQDKTTPTEVTRRGFLKWATGALALVGLGLGGLWLIRGRKLAD